jgi:hypothetical protein
MTGPFFSFVFFIVFRRTNIINQSFENTPEVDKQSFEVQLSDKLFKYSLIYIEKVFFCLFHL